MTSRVYFFLSVFCDKFDISLTILDSVRSAVIWELCLATLLASLKAHGPRTTLKILFFWLTSPSSFNDQIFIGELKACHHWNSLLFNYSWTKHMEVMLNLCWKWKLYKMALSYKIKRFSILNFLYSNPTLFVVRNHVFPSLLPNNSFTHCCKTNLHSTWLQFKSFYWKRHFKIWQKVYLFIHCFAFNRRHLDNSWDCSFEVS